MGNHMNDKVGGFMLVHSCCENMYCVRTCCSWNEFILSSLYPLSFLRYNVYVKKLSRAEIGKSWSSYMNV